MMGFTDRGRHWNPSKTVEYRFGNIEGFYDSSNGYTGDSVTRLLRLPVDPISITECLSLIRTWDGLYQLLILEGHFGLLSTRPLTPSSKSASQSSCLVNGGTCDPSLSRKEHPRLSPSVLTVERLAEQITTARNGSDVA